jgi:hypothetical protein
MSEDLENYIKIQPKEFGVQEILNVIPNYMRVKILKIKIF